MARARPGQPSARATTCATTASESEGMVRRTSSPACSAESALMAKTSKVGPLGAAPPSSPVPSTSTSLVPARRARSSRARSASPSRSASSTSTTASPRPRGSASIAPSSISSASPTSATWWASIHATGRRTPSDQAMRRRSVLRPDPLGPVMTMPPPTRSAAICVERAFAGPSSPTMGHTRPPSSRSGSAEARRRGGARWRARRRWGSARPGRRRWRGRPPRRARRVSGGSFRAPPRRAQHLVERGAERVDLGADGERLALEELGRGVARGEPLGLGAALAPGGREAEIDQARRGRRCPTMMLAGLRSPCRRSARCRRVSWSAASAMAWSGVAGSPASPIRSARLRPSTSSRTRYDRPPVAGQLAEAKHPRHAEPLDARERHRLAHQRLHLALLGVLGQRLEGHDAPGDPVAHGPHLAAAAFAERRHLGGIPRAGATGATRSRRLGTCVTTSGIP